MRDLHVATDVAHLVGSADLRHLAEGASACLACRGALPDGERAAVVAVQVGPNVALARLTHPTCCPSTVVDLDPAELGLDPDDVAAAVTGQETPAVASAGLLPSPAGPAPVIVVQLGDAHLATPADAGDRVDLVVAGLINRGLHLHTQPTQLPPTATGWTVTLGEGTVRIAAGGHVLYDGELTTWPDWTNAAARLGGVVLLTGTLTDHTAAAVQHAARAGTLVAGRVDVVGRA